MNCPTVRRVRAAALIAAALGLLVTGCDDEPEIAPPERTMEQVREQTVAATRDVASVLESIDVPTRRAVGGPSMCTDNGTEWRHRTEVFLGLPDSHETGSTQLAEQVRDAFVQQGWQPYESEGSYEDGIDVEGDPGEQLWIIRVRRDDIQDVLVYTWDYRSYIRADVLGQCIPATDEERDAYFAEDRRPVDLKASD